MIVNENTTLYTQYNTPANIAKFGVVPFTGTATIIGNPVVGETLTVKLENSNATAATPVSCTWRAQGALSTMADDVSLLLTEAHIGMPIRAEVHSYGSFSGVIQSAFTAPVAAAE